MGVVVLRVVLRHASLFDGRLGLHPEVGVTAREHAAGRQAGGW